MNVETIQAAIKDLPEAERRRLADWFETLEEQAWDEQIERDFSPGGRGAPLLARLSQDGSI